MTGPTPLESNPVPMENDRLLLVVDDEAPARQIYQLTLESAGYRVVTAHDGAEALERITEVRPAAVLTDLHMPRVDGDELARRLHERLQPPPPVILVSSDGPALTRVNATHVFSVLEKPVDPTALLDAVARALGA